MWQNHINQKEEVMIANRILLVLVINIIPLVSVADEAKQIKRFTLHADVGTVLGVSISGPERLLPDEWQTRFMPQGGSMDLTDTPLFWNLRLGLTPELIVSRGLYLGFPVGFRLTAPVRRTWVDWWDPVIVQSIRIKATSPSFGVSLALERKRGVWWKVQITAIPYSTWRTDYKGIDRYGRANTSNPITDTEIGRGFGQSFSIGVCSKDIWYTPLSIALVVERYQPNIVVLGAHLGIHVRLR